MMIMHLKHKFIKNYLVMNKEKLKQKEENNINKENKIK